MSQQIHNQRPQISDISKINGFVECIWSSNIQIVHISESSTWFIKSVEIDKRTVQGVGILFSSLVQVTGRVCIIGNTDIVWLNDLRDGQKGIKAFTKQIRMKIKIRKRNLNGVRYPCRSRGTKTYLVTKLRLQNF